MTINRTARAIKPRKNRRSRFWDFFVAPVWNFFTEPHPSVQEVGELRRAQLLSSITLILAGLFTWAMFSGPSTVSTFVSLYIITLISYVLGRTRYYRTGSYFFSYGITALTFFSLFVGTANSFDGTITTIGHLSLIIASILLSLRGFVILVLLSTFAAFIAPSYSQIPVPTDDSFFRVVGVFMSIGIILIGANIFRTRLESDRLREVRKINRELEDIK